MLFCIMPLDIPGPGINDDPIRETLAAYLAMAVFRQLQGFFSSMGIGSRFRRYFFPHHVGDSKKPIFFYKFHFFYGS